MRGKRIAVTGARGRLAPRVMELLSRHGAEIVPFSRTPDETHRALSSLADPEVLGAFDIVLHLAWSSVPLVSEENPGIEEREDLVFLRRLAAAAGAGRTPQIVFFSTAAVYGNTRRHPATEESPCEPLGRYAAAKLAAEQIVAGIPRSCILRVTNVFGPLSTEKPQGIIPLLYRACHTGTPVTIWGDGSATKDYLHVDDFATAVEAVLRAGLSGIYNVASGHSLSLREIIELVEAASRRKLIREYTAHYPWDVEYSVVSPARLTVATGWRAVHNPAESIRRMMAE
jgi:Nucleoside-diphosphate-sugar epimerases